MSKDQRIPTRIVQQPFKAMTSQEIDEYMTNLASTNGKDLKGIEVEVESSLRTVATQRTQIARKVVQLRSQVEEMVENDKHLNGQMKALGYILQRAEDERRFEKQREEEKNTDVKGSVTSLENSRRKE